MIWLEQKPEKPELQHCRLQTPGQSCQCPLNLGAEQKARKSSGQLQAPRKPLQEPACAGKGTHGANSHISPVENGAGAANRQLRIPSFLPPLPASVSAAPGTRNPSDVTCPIRPSGAQRWSHQRRPARPVWHLGARGTEAVPAAAIPSQPSWAVPGNTTETFRRDQGMQGDRDASIPWEKKGLPILIGWWKLGTWLTTLNSQHLQA